MRGMRIGSHTIDPPVVLAPMAGVTDKPFRQLCKRLGAGLAVSEMTTADPRTPGPKGPNTFFLPDAFASGQLGHFGTSSRQFFHGPGLNNTDLGLMKRTTITESTAFEIRFEMFNIFNHAQFNNPDGDFTSDLFGVVTSARDPRIGQLSAKFYW